MNKEYMHFRTQHNALLLVDTINRLRAEGLDASAVMINDHTAFRVDWMPFAGLRHSGHGVGGIHFSLEEMQVSKMAVLRSLSL